MEIQKAIYKTNVIINALTILKLIYLENAFKAILNVFSFNI
jgi:hypothetical protein